MALIIDEFYEYQHKKFDQNKRKRCNSSSSQMEDYEYRQVHIERVSERAQSQQSSEYSSSCQHNEEEFNTASPPPYKRLRTSSLSSTNSSYTTSSTYTIPPHTNHHSSPSTPNNFKPITAHHLPSTSAILPKISHDTLRSICRYHGNMVRQFPKKVRTPKDQERRNKNTIACRMSRRVKKLELVAIEEQYKEFSQQTFTIIEQVMRATAYLNELIKLTKENENIEQRHIKMEMLTEENQTSNVVNGESKPFSIAYLMGNRD